MVLIKKLENFNNLILLLHNIDTNIKKISKQSQFYVKSNVFNILAIKLLFILYNSAPTKLFIIIRVIIVYFLFNITIGIYFDFMNMSNMIR